MNAAQRNPPPLPLQRATRTSRALGKGTQRSPSRAVARAAAKAAPTPPKLKLAKTLWGVPADKSNWDDVFARISAEGWSGVEAITLGWREDPDLFCSLLEKHHLQLICQLHTTGGDLDTNFNYNYLTSLDPADHVSSLATLLEEAKALEPVLINVHSGHDSWSTSTAVDYFKAALEVEAAAGIPLVHETHRQRLLGNPYQAAEILQQPGLETLKLNADLSHWCVACERVFDASEHRDAWWPAVLELTAKHTHLVHNRVGWEQSPQVADPSAPESAAAVHAHLRWWAAIWQAERGLAESWNVAEFGPAPYLPALPHTQMPVADLWDVNAHIARRVREHFAATFPAP